MELKMEVAVELQREGQYANEGEDSERAAE